MRGAEPEQSPRRRESPEATEEEDGAGGGGGGGGMKAAGARGRTEGRGENPWRMGERCCPHPRAEGAPARGALLPPPPPIAPPAAQYRPQRDSVSDPPAPQNSISASGGSSAPHGDGMYAERTATPRPHHSPPYGPLQTGHRLLHRSAPPPPTCRTPWRGSKAPQKGKPYRPTDSPPPGGTSTPTSPPDPAVGVGAPRALRG